MISAATTLAAAKKGANWPRAISCASRSGLLPSSGSRDGHAQRFAVGQAR